VTAALVVPVGAAQYVYPAKGQTPQQQQAGFDKACATCLEGKGYTVK